MDKSIVHIEIDEYFENIFSHYKSKKRDENEIMCSFFLDTEEVRASICYQIDSMTEELKHFSFDLKITDNIQEFLMKIEEINYFKVINKLNIFYELIDQKIDGLSFTFSKDFELQSVMLIDQSFDMNKRIFSSELDTIINTYNLTENDMADILIAQHINLDSDIIDEVLDIKVPDFNDDKKSIVHFLEKFRQRDVKSLHISKKDLINVAIESFADRLTNNNLTFESKVENFEYLIIRCRTRSFTYRLKIITTYNKVKNNLDITFRASCGERPGEGYLPYLLQITDNENFYSTMEVLKANVNKIKKPIEYVTIDLSSDHSINYLCLNNFVTFDNDELNSMECLSDIMFIKYLYFHYKDVIDSQYLEFFNATILSNNPPYWRHVIDDFYKHKTDVFAIINMTII